MRPDRVVGFAGSCAWLLFQRRVCRLDLKRVVRHAFPHDEDCPFAMVKPRF